MKKILIEMGQKSIRRHPPSFLCERSDILSAEKEIEVKDIESIKFNKCIIRTYFKSLFPKPYTSYRMLYFCEKCLLYFIV